MGKHDWVPEILKKFDKQKLVTYWLSGEWNYFIDPDLCTGWMVVAIYSEKYRHTERDVEYRLRDFSKCLF